LTKFTFPFGNADIGKQAGSFPDKSFWNGKKNGGETHMGIFDPDDVITTYSLREAIEDGALVEIFKKRWGELSAGKPIVATASLYTGVSLAALREIWNEYALWKRNVEKTLPVEKRLFQTKVNNLPVWVIEDAVAFTLLYPEDY
jgi:hypothetical protein